MIIFWILNLEVYILCNNVINDQLKYKLPIPIWFGMATGRYEI